ncbi:F-box protein SKIP28 [Cornus florida]|uniref:F-box protein SKIP28 n=1 Tax=Cornus florida TaxID=4283 RepID=UPI00289D9BA0|nr:F-box protein SKIP28 [Cornus florida]
MNPSLSAENKEEEVIDNSTHSSPPHEAMFLVLAYLPLFELLALSQACRSLRDAVNNDILPWLNNIVVKKPLNSRLSDDILMKIASKSNGRMRTLALVNCVKITDDGLQRVVEKNPLISKLYIPSCTALTPEGVINTVKILTGNNLSLVSLKISGIYNINKEHLKTLHSYLDINPRLQRRQKQQCSLYVESKKFSTFGHDESDCPLIDIDICPKCDEVRMVFDCPKESCEIKRQLQQIECRGCYHCIPRCEECGKCIGFEELGEAACADFLCSECWFELPKCNFCNQPYCSQHADQQCSLPGSSGFVCGDCYMKFISNSND